MLRRVALIIFVVALIMPAAAPAQNSPFAPLPPAQTQAPEPEPTPTSAGDDGLKGWQQALIILAGGLLIAGIGWAIVSDAKSRAPQREATGEREAARTRREADLKRRKQRSRAATKRSRAARKRNR